MAVQSLRLERVGVICIYRTLCADDLGLSRNGAGRAAYLSPAMGNAAYISPHRPTDRRLVDVCPQLYPGLAVLDVAAVPEADLC